MTEEEVRALIASVVDKIAEKAASRVTEAGIQLDTAMLYVSNIAEEVAAEVRNGG